jgi:hypothetical protein
LYRYTESELAAAETAEEAWRLVVASAEADATKVRAKQRQAVVKHDTGRSPRWSDESFAADAADAGGEGANQGAPGKRSSGHVAVSDGDTEAASESLRSPGRRGTPLESWCEENGERGAKLLAEYADTEKGPREVAKGSKYKALWNCIDCGHEWRARVTHRTDIERPRGCAGKMATETHNLKLACEESGGRLAHLLEEWNHPTMRMEDFTPCSAEKVPWKCECGAEWDARISSRTGSDRPSGCPQCGNHRRGVRK